ncbi:hypothetical protein [Streptomyces sp. SPB4]|uniref:hypothetical protein n=1 Tax=Streptomyces sp. SPB4 TaxID=2940553 RepID=UPI00247E12D3|nr:hypothetical protein [Streptomyces sp. SPB4]
MRWWAKRSDRVAGTSARRAVSFSWGSSGPPAAAEPVAKPPVTTSGVTQAGSAATGVRDPTDRVPPAMPDRTSRHWRARAPARSRVAASSWVSEVRRARASRSAA